MSAGRALLRLDGVSAGYGHAQVLHGVELEIAAGEVVALMGRNGMGKTTAVRAIFGQTGWTQGSIAFAGRPISGLAAHEVARAGIGLVAEGRHVFPNLTVAENLTVTAANRAGRGDPWTGERVFDLFPQLSARAATMGSALSGGEQQMLAIGRALTTNPALLILDEATEGLAPTLREQIWVCLADLKRRGQSILLIDKHVQATGVIADRNVILEKGRVVWTGRPADLAADPQVAARFLGV